MKTIICVGLLLCLGLVYATALPLPVEDIEQSEQAVGEKDLEPQEARGWGGGGGWGHGGGGGWGHGGGSGWGHGGGGWGHGGGGWGHGGGGWRHG